MEGLRSSRRSSRRLMAEINVVPYIDVMLVLVVILMVAAPFVNPSLVNLPSVKKAEKAPEAIVEVIVHPTGAMSVRKGKELLAVDMPGLIATVKKHKKDVLIFRLSLLLTKSFNMNKSSML